MNKFIKYPLTLGIVGVICGGALGLVYEITDDVIIAREAKAAQKLLGDIVPEVVYAPSVKSDYPGDAVKKAKIEEIYEISDANEDVIAYGYQANVVGYEKNLKFLVVLSYPEETIKGFKVISHEETAGPTLGAALLDSPEFAEQFSGISFSDLGSEVDFVAGSTAKTTLNAVKNGVDGIISFHKENILKQEASTIELTSQEMNKVQEALSEGDTLVDKTEDFKAALKSKVTNNVYNSIINVEAAEETEYVKIWNYLEILDASGNVKGYAYVAQGQYNCEVEHGARKWQDHKFVFMFDKDGGNTKVIIVKNGDTLSGAGKEPLESNAWLSDNFNGKTVTQLVNDLKSESIDILAGATFTTDYFRAHFGVVADAHVKAYGN